MIPEKVINYYKFEHSIKYSEAENVFRELEEFLSDASKEGLSPSKSIDAAWHAFILHTKEYSEYCLNKFGRFIHHVPDERTIPAVHGSSLAKCSSHCKSDCWRDS